MQPSFVFLSCKQRHLLSELRLDVLDVDGGVRTWSSGGTVPSKSPCVNAVMGQVYLLITGACAVDESAAHFAGLTWLSSLRRSGVQLTILIPGIFCGETTAMAFWPFFVLFIHALT